MAKRIQTADVVVVGMGNAASSAAAAARDAGVKVLMVEKAPKERSGGNSRWTASAQHRFVHNGVEDVKKLAWDVSEDEIPNLDITPYTKDDYYTDMMRVTRGLGVPELVELLVNESAPTVFWMKEKGIRWELLRSGAELRGGRLVWHHGNNVVNPVGGGAGLVPMWTDVLERKGIDILYQTAATSLETDETGAITGLVVQDMDGFYKIRCKAVVLGCGGFQANPAMRAQYLGAEWDLVHVRGTRYDTGDGINMALAIGAQPFGQWGGCHSTPIDADSGVTEGGYLDPETRKHMTHRYMYVAGIMVNLKGQRFIDEGEDFHTYTYAKTGGEIVKQPQNLAYQVFDAKSVTLVPEYMYGGAATIVANSIEGLANKLDLDADAFVRTVSEFNKAVDESTELNTVIRDGRAARGVQPGKSNWAQKVDSPPFTAYAVT
ncbi:MAG: FAD-dependent tricarballylate dehydrogenase TcuA, partial [Dehalococcoidia bacterium]|nr:FAD-dependent tricarballylate dehydrogenase TcuA [Dehalococcoidia bacterium]